MENYTDWASFPKVVNQQPFGVASKDPGLDMFMNEPSYFEIMENNTQVELDLKAIETLPNGTSILYTSRFSSRRFRVAPVYSLLFSVDTKTNTELVEKIHVITERPNDAIQTEVLVTEICLFVLLVIGLICIGFEHADVKLKRWLPPSRSLLMLIVLQIFSSPVYQSLFTLFELEAAKGFGLGSELLSIIVDVLHLLFWMEAFFFEMSLGAIAEVLWKSLVTCLAVTQILRRGINIATELHLLDSLTSVMFYVELVYFCLAGIYLLVGILAWVSLMRRPRQTRMEEKDEQKEEKVEEEEDLPVPNNDLLSRYIGTMALLVSALFLLAPAWSMRSGQGAFLLLLAGRVIPILTDLISFYLVCPSGVDLTFEDEEYTSDDTYDEPTGFIQGIKDKEIERERELKTGNPDSFARNREQGREKRIVEPRVEQEMSDIDVDVEVDNMDYEDYSDENQEEQRHDEEI